MAEPPSTLNYAAPAPARPASLRVAMWLNVAVALSSLVFVAYGVMMLGWAARAIGGSFDRKDFATAGAICTIYGGMFVASSVFCAIALRVRRWRGLTRALSIFPISFAVPLGTAAGLYTYMILGSPTIRSAYEANEHARV